MVLCLLYTQTIIYNTVECQVIYVLCFGVLVLGVGGVADKARIADWVLWVAVKKRGQPHKRDCPPPVAWDLYTQ